MGLRETLTNPRSRWMDGDGPEADVVVSSRVRLARNLKDFFFPHRLKPAQKEEVLHAVRVAANRPEVASRVGKLELVRLVDLTPVERQILVEKHLVSPDFIKGDLAGRGLLLREDEVVSVMINEEDHLRIQCLLPGLELEAAWEIANRVDDALELTLEYAYHQSYGYLTACPTNVGTGLRVSSMLHLPGLVLVGAVDEMITNLSKLGLAVRGLYGEGTRAAGDLFQISNQITLGRKEEEIIRHLYGIIRKLVAQERESRETLYRQKERLEDRVFRAYGILRYARAITSQEAMRLLSDLRLGVALGIIKGVPLSLVTELMVLIQPALIIKTVGKNLSPGERDVVRARLIREKLENIRG
ncbi:ATP:guanido phosphotransferase [Ammonifex degensii KC4]|uniref:Protein-arginine kinase n=1 Tax=Ammonifex degensii (strain DSM 10501 / KC4) TaxID=429009 RepID=C9R9P9_AMMDK|nr:protein arginine kinase [Ammonifex degensii]ACX53028.1 ATP:guanido phosphotransferase [Ammonifex degensii KC4]